jgi:hypothetical protein
MENVVAVHGGPLEGKREAPPGLQEKKERLQSKQADICRDYFGIVENLELYFLSEFAWSGDVWAAKETTAYLSCVTGI